MGKQSFAAAIAGSLFAAGPLALAALAAPGDGGAHPLHDHDHDRDAGLHDAAPRETKDQRAYRMAYIADTVKEEREITKHHVWIAPMSAASWKHWRRAYKALRVRELAQDDGEDAAVARVDAYLKKETDHFLALMTELTAKAPEVPPAPTLLSPAEGAKAAVGTAVTFKMAPYKDAAHYYCWFWEPGGHYWSSWQPSTSSYGTTPECTIAADDPRWAKFRTGKAEFHGRAIVQTKAGDGKDYKVWSDPVKLEVAVTGGAAPASAEGGAK